MTYTKNDTIISENTRISDSKQIVHLALQYVDDHLYEKISLSNMAYQLNVCRSTLVQCFRQITGISPYAYVLQRKLSASQKLIQEGISPIRVAEQIGFGDYSSFYRAFRKEYGMSPNQWKDHVSNQQSSKP